MPMVDWRVEKECETNRSDRSFHSQHDSVTRDSGAGDSVISETENTSAKSEKHFIKTNIPLIYNRSTPGLSGLPVKPGVSRKPTFSTFVGDSDSDSVHFEECESSLPVH